MSLAVAVLNGAWVCAGSLTTRADGTLNAASPRPRRLEGIDMTGKETP